MVFLLDLYHWFFIDLQISTEWTFDFLNTVIIIFCLIHSLNVPHSDQNSSLFFLIYWSLSINSQSLLYISTTVGVVTKKYFKFSFGVILPLSQETDWCLVLMTNLFIKFVLQRSLFIFLMLSSKIQLSISGILIVMGKPMKKCLPWHIDKRLDINCYSCLVLYLYVPI